MKHITVASIVSLVALAACAGDDAPTVYFDREHANTPATFWDFPFPSDERLDANGAPDITGFPNPRNVPILSDLLSLVPDRRGWPTMPAVYFRFTHPVEVSLDIVYVGVEAPVALIDIDPSSPERGRVFPLKLRTLADDAYVTSNVLAAAPVPGIVVRANTKYAYVINRATIHKGFPELERPDGFNESLYPDLWTTLDLIGASRDTVVAATVFTTGDEIARIRSRSEAIRAGYEPTLTGVQLVGGDTYTGFCRLSAQITMPQFQTGTPPFDMGGRFELGDDDVPAKQADMTIPVVITLPKRTMPASGWPLYQFFHGSGGVSTGVVDLGYSPTSADEPEPGKGPGYVVALHGIAAASSAMPVNPERLGNATDYSYLNINNLAAFPQTFQQGVFEQRLLLDALLALRVPDSVLAGCTGIASGGGEHFFDPQKLVAGGQSMGGMYTNLVGAVEERFGALVPTGAGGFWNLMILESQIIPGARALLGTALGVDDSELTFMHPAMNTVALAWEIAEPFAAMARIARRPLPGLPARHVYEPIAKDDVYFPTLIYDAAALAYGNQQAGPDVWPQTQTSLNYDGFGGRLDYPVTANLDGKTRVVVQFEGDGIIDAHYIYRQLETVKHQYGCFFATYFRDGVPTLPAPNVLGHPCP
ncbi:MAG TPA: hypothetical protein VIV11_37700 [Kofleriaceae bacterium]